MKTILFVATVSRHFYYFHQPAFRMLRDAGWGVDTVAAQDAGKPLRDCRHSYDLPFQRAPLRRGNLKAFFALRKIIRAGGYDIIHCHTPVGGLVGRLAARGSGAKVYYTAHGFHFCKGSSRLSWLLYYPLERLLARCTDCLITINDEDFALARARLPAREVRHVHGVGCDTRRFAPVSPLDRQIIRVRLGLPPDALALVFVAELNANKNQALLLRAMPPVLEQFPQTRLLLVGPDHYGGQLQALAKELKLENTVYFLGERGDVPHLLAAADVAVASSLREGLPVNVMEAMACGLPVAASDNRGHRELVAQGETGLLVDPSDPAAMAEAIRTLLAQPELRARFGAAGRERVMAYSVDRVLEELRAIYLGE